MTAKTAAWTALRSLKAREVASKRVATAPMEVELDPAPVQV